MIAWLQKLLEKSLSADYGITSRGIAISREGKKYDAISPSDAVPLRVVRNGILRIRALQNRAAING